MKYNLLYGILALSIITMYYNENESNDEPEIIILNNFYDSETFNKIKNISRKDIIKKVKVDNRLKSRKTFMFKKDNESFPKLKNLLYDRKFLNNLETKIDKKVIDNNFPIEYRIYDKDSYGMNWHSDLSIFDGPYYECVLTLSNSSNSKFKYKNKKGEIKIINTKPNTLVCVLPNSIIHSVTPTEYGERDIIKFVINFEGNKPNENYDSEISGYDSS